MSAVIDGAFPPNGNPRVELPPQPGLWRSVGKLLQLRVAIFFNNFRRSKLRHKIGMVILLLFGLAFLGGVFFLTWQFLRFVRMPEFKEITGQLGPLFERVPTFVFTGAFIGIFITSFGVLLQALYLAGDMDFLLATPVPIRAVFVAKLLQAILPNFALICLFALPVLYGVGASSNFSWLYYPAAFILMTALALAAAGLSGLLVMMVVRVIPARRVAEVLGFLGAVFSFLCSQSGQLARYTDIDPNQAAGAWTWLENTDLNWSPLTWAANGITALGEGRWLQGAGLTLLALGLAAAVFAISLTTAERLYYNGWAGMQNKGHKKRPARAARSTGAEPNLAERAFHLIPAPVRGMLIKDWLVLRRDLRNLSQLVTPLILGIVYAITLLGGNDRPAPRPGTSVLLSSVMNNVSTYASVGLSLFVGWMLLGRLAGMGFSQEGKSFWLLKTAPVRAGQMIAAKYLVAYLPTLALSVVYLLGIWLIQSAPLSVMAYSLLVVALCIAGNASINLAFGIAGANMAWEDPRQMQRTATGCLGALATMAYLPVCLALFFGPPVLVPLAGWSPLAGQAIGLALGGGFSLMCAVIPLALVKGQVEKLGEG